MSISALIKSFHVLDQKLTKFIDKQSETVSERQRELNAASTDLRQACNLKKKVETLLND